MYGKEREREREREREVAFREAGRIIEVTAKKWGKKEKEKKRERYI